MRSLITGGAGFIGSHLADEMLERGHRVQKAYSETTGQALLDHLLAVDVQTYLSGDLLTKVDIATMSHSLEGRSPLLDHPFMEFAARLPVESKLRGARQKRLFKDAVAPWLPKEVLSRPKKGFSVPLASWLRGPLRRSTNDVLLDRSCLERGYFRPDAVRRLIDDHMTSRADNANQLWALIQLELWHHSFVDGPR